MNTAIHIKVTDTQQNPLSACPSDKMHSHFFIGLSEHALYIKVRDEDCRPPLDRLIGYYPKNLLVLIIDMWQSDSSMVRLSHLY